MPKRLKFSLRELFLGLSVLILLTACGGGGGGGSDGPGGGPKQSGLKEADAERNAVDYMLFLTYFSHCSATGTCGPLVFNTDIKHLFGAFEEIYDPALNVSNGGWQACSNYNGTDSPSTSATPNGDTGYIIEYFNVPTSNKLVFDYYYFAANCITNDTAAGNAQRTNGSIRYATSNYQLVDSVTSTYSIDYIYLQNEGTTGSPFVQEVTKIAGGALVSRYSADLSMTGIYTVRSSNRPINEPPAGGNGTIGYNLTLHGWEQFGSSRLDYNQLNDFGSYKWTALGGETLDNTLTGGFSISDPVHQTNLTFSGLQYLDSFSNSGTKWFYSYSLSGQINFSQTPNDLCPDVNGSFTFGTLTPVKWDLSITSSYPIQGQENINGNVVIAYNPDGSSTATVDGEVHAYPQYEDMFTTCP